MQVYCVSRSPRRPVLIAIALGVGILGLTAGLLPLMQGSGLASNATFVRLLGYAPGTPGAALTVMSAADAGEGRALVSASSVPGPTPAPPAVATRTSEGASPTGVEGTATAADRDGFLLDLETPAVLEANETADDLGSLGAFGLGVLPEDAGDVRGAPTIEAFVTPDLEEDDRCDWTREFHATDEDYFSKVYYWATPQKACGDERGDKCKDFSEWVQAWTEIKG